MPGIFGNIDKPLDNPYFRAPGGQGLFLLLGNLFKFLVVVAGIFLVFQIISAGYLFIAANGDLKKVEIAWNKIWQSILGLVIIASAFVLTALVERFTGIHIINFQICGPNGCVN